MVKSEFPRFADVVISHWHQKSRLSPFYSTFIRRRHSSYQDWHMALWSFCCLVTVLLQVGSKSQIWWMKRRSLYHFANSCNSNGHNFRVTTRFQYAGMSIVDSDAPHKHHTNMISTRFIFITKSQDSRWVGVVAFPTHHPRLVPHHAHCTSWQ